MAPDLNTVPRSPRTPSNPTMTATRAPPPSSSTHERRTSTQMLPPPPPRNDSLPNSPRDSVVPSTDNTGVGLGPGPIRHPRPMTAAELHLDMEKEQESIVNRLTRELSALRAQTASVASTTSSTSDHFFTNDPLHVNMGTSNTIIPTSARRHRSSSNLSTRSARSIRDNLASTSATGVSGVAAPRDQSVQASSRPSMDIQRPEMSRQNSTSAAGYRSSSINASPHLTQATYAHPHRTSITGYTNASSAGVEPSSHPSYPRSPSFSSAIATARYEEATQHKAELEAVKRENEMLRARIKELEKNLAASENAK